MSEMLRISDHDQKAKLFDEPFFLKKVLWNVC